MATLPKGSRAVTVNDSGAPAVAGLGKPVTASVLAAAGLERGCPDWAPLMSGVAVRRPK